MLQKRASRQPDNKALNRQPDWRPYRWQTAGGITWLTLKVFFNLALSFDNNLTALQSWVSDATLTVTTNMANAVMCVALTPGNGFELLISIRSQNPIKYSYYCTDDHASLVILVDQVLKAVAYDVSKGTID
jgi:Na+-transporting NADH:ubiquinone oxidoreductase subunit NqrD